jgi:hypothetical protein
VWHRVLAVARGAGLFGGDLTAEEPIDVICNPAPEGQVLGLDVRVEGYEAALGVCTVHSPSPSRAHIFVLQPYVVALTTPHVTVGGLLRASLHLFDPPADLQIHAFSVFVIQKTSLFSRQNASLTCEADPQRHLLFRIDKPDPRRKQGGGTPPPTPPPTPGTELNCFPWTDSLPSSDRPTSALFTRTALGALSATQVVRLPSDTTLRPTTQTGTKDAPIRHTHEVIYLSSLC